jgi:pyrroline-5-carboxylate reductase
MLEECRIAFIGSGAMGEAMIAGICERGLVSPSQIVATDAVAARREVMAQRYGIQTGDDNAAAVRAAAVVVLSVKPQVLPAVAADLRGRLPAGALVLSIMAGVSINTLRHGLGHDRIVRSMPNTPAQVGKGMTVWTATPAVSDVQRGQAEAILGALGEQIAVGDEHYLDMATGLSGSGPGFVFLILEAMIDAGVQIGFSRADAQKMVLQTVEGSVALMRATGLHPAELRNRVTSPAGTTAAGLHALEEGNLRAVISRAIQAAYHRSQDLGVASEEKGSR